MSALISCWLRKYSNFPTLEATEGSQSFDVLLLVTDILKEALQKRPLLRK